MYEISFRDLRLFAIISTSLFVIAAIAIFILPKQYPVRSSFDVGFVLNNEKTEPVEAPELVAKQISAEYLAQAVLELSAQNDNVQALNALQKGFTAEPVGRIVSLQNIVVAKSEDLAKKLQQSILTKFIRDRQVLVGAIRNGLLIRFDSAKRAVADLERQSTNIQSEINEAKHRAENSSELGRQFRQNLQNLISKSAEGTTLDQRVGVEAQIRELRDQVSAQENMAATAAQDQSRFNRDLTEVRKSLEEQTRTVALTERDRGVLTEPRILQAPTLVPIPAGPGRLLILLGALGASALIALGCVILSNRQLIRLSR